MQSAKDFDVCVSRHVLHRIVLRLLLTIAGSALALAAAPVAHATLVFYTDQASFEAAAPSLAHENFETANVGSGAVKTCSDPYGRATSDDCWQTGAVAPSLSISSLYGNGTTVVGPYFRQNNSVMTGINTSVPGNILRVSFPSATTAIGMYLIRQEAVGNVVVSAYGPAGPALITTAFSTAPTGTFLGIVSTGESLERLDLSVLDSDAVYVDDVFFGAQVAVDLALSLSTEELPAGTFTYTLGIANQSGSGASSVVVSATLPPELPIVSHDCGVLTGTALSWNVGAIAAGQAALCHITTSVPAPVAVMATAKVYGAQWDPVVANNAVTLYSNAVGGGPATPQNSMTLFRSFPDLAFKDETGAPFSLRANKDKVILMQVCSVWCVPCNLWTEMSANVKTAVDQAIGPGHFLDVDLLWEGPSHLPSTQTNAAAWKSHWSFPGPVLHAEGSLLSPVSTLLNQESIQYYAEQASFFIPQFLILAPDCDNQIAVRGFPGTPEQMFGENRSIDTSTVNDVAALVTQVWQQRPCVKPLLHRLDLCAVGSAPILSVPQNGKSVEAAEVFTVPSGRRFDIAGVTVVTDAPLIDFTVYADAAGVPGAAVCSAPARTATPVYDSGARRFALDPRCTLGPGNYWMSLKGRSATDTAAFTWYGGLLSRNSPYLIRDALNTLGQGCTNWSPAGTCVAAAQQKTELCFVLDQGDVLFSSGFEVLVP
jgi:hypothetical protein